MDEKLYEQIYRRLHPRPMPYSPYCRQLELRDLWPCDQEKFKREVDEILKAAKAAE